MSWWRRQEAEGEEPSGGWREGNGARAGATIAPRAGLCVAAVASAVGGRWGGAGGGRCAGRRALFCLLLSPWSGSGCRGGPAPSGRPANGGGGGGESAALPGGKATPRSSRATRRAGKSASGRGCGRERGGRGDEASLSRVPPPPSAPPAPRLCCLLRGLRRGFPEAVAVTPAGSGGDRGLVPSGNGREAGLGERGRRAARSPRRVRGAGQG